MRIMVQQGDKDNLVMETELVSYTNKYLHFASFNQEKQQYVYYRTFINKENADDLLIAILQDSWISLSDYCVECYDPIEHNYIAI